MGKRVIFDVGLHKGQDTEYYLARGFHVVAIEADPDLVSFCQHKFKDFIASGALEIVHGAVVEDDSQQWVNFYKNNRVSVWGTVVKSWADRSQMLGADYVEIDVPVINFRELFSLYGCPYYLKIDIEGMDLVCLRKLLDLDCRPKYVSIESEKVSFASLLDEFETLHSLGYRKYYIQQMETISSSKVPPNSDEGEYVEYKFPSGSTGLFGSDLRDNWLSKDEALSRYRDIFKDYKYFGDYSPLRRTSLGKSFLSVLSKVAGRPLPGWYDTHASL